MTIKKQLDLPSYYIDLMLDEMHTSNDPMYLEIMKEIDKMDRITRRFIGNMAVNRSIEVSERKIKSGYVSTTIKNNEETVSISFYFSTEERAIVKQFITVLGTAVRSKYKTNKAIVIGTTPTGIDYHYFDFVLIKGPISEIPEFSSFPQEIQNLVGKEKNVTNDEYPQNIIIPKYKTYSIDEWIQNLGCCTKGCDKNWVWIGISRSKRGISPLCLDHTKMKWSGNLEGKYQSIYEDTWINLGKCIDRLCAEEIIWANRSIIDQRFHEISYYCIDHLEAFLDQKYYKFTKRLDTFIYENKLSTNLY